MLPQLEKRLFPQTQTLPNTQTLGAQNIQQNDLNQLNFKPETTVQTH